MLFPQLVEYIKNAGCSIFLYDRKELKVAQCVGTFDIAKNGNPLICLATKGHTHIELMQILLHEYAHFLQWEEGFLHKLEGEDLKKGWDVFDLWLRKKKKYSPEELVRSRNAVLLIEYDADLRVIDLAKELNIDIGSHIEHLENAYSYIVLIKWAFKNRKWDSHPGAGAFSGAPRTPKQILASLTTQEEEIVDNLLIY